MSFQLYYTILVSSIPVPFVLEELQVPIPSPSPFRPGDIEEIIDILAEHKDNDILAKHKESLTLFKAACSGDVRSVRALLGPDTTHGDAYFVNFEYSGSRPLDCAARGLEPGHTMVVNDLLEAGADPNHIFREGTALLSATFNMNHQMVRILLKGGADPDHQWMGTMPLDWLLSKGYMDMASTFIEFGARSSVHSQQ